MFKIGAVYDFSNFCNQYNVVISPCGTYSYINIYEEWKHKRVNTHGIPMPKALLGHMELDKKVSVRGFSSEE